MYTLFLKSNCIAIKYSNLKCWVFKNKNANSTFVNIMKCDNRMEWYYTTIIYKLKKHTRIVQS